MTASDRSALNRTGRQDAIARLARQEVDVVIIGGGVVGAGCALDAVTRGLTVALVEARDFAAGTSSRSTKLFHGGLRYLEQFNVGLVREALRERDLAMRTLSPHLVRPVPFLYPLLDLADRAYVGLGIGVYDVLGAGRGVPGHHRHLGRRKALECFQSGNTSTIRGAIRFYEGQVDDARHTMMLARTAAGFGAHCVTSARVTGFLRDGARVAGVSVEDRETGAQFDVRAGHVINATGVWSDEIQALLGEHGPFRIRASKGVHLTVPRDRIRSSTGIISRTEKSLLFIIPWGQHWLIGTTDTDWQLDLAHPAASQADVDYLIARANALLDDPLTRADVVGAYAGLRPLLAAASDSTSALSREHAVVSPVPGLTVVAGGKYTTYRVMAREVVDAAVHELGRGAPRSCTERTPIAGADGYWAAHNCRRLIAEQAGLSIATIEHLLGRYGTLYRDIVGLVAERPELGRPLATAPAYLRAEVHYAATHEGALHLDDVLTRRTRISIEVPDRGWDAAEEVADLLAPVLGWSAGEQADEIAHYRGRIRAELAAQAEPDDHTANTRRLMVPDIRALRGA